MSEEELAREEAYKGIYFIETFMRQRGDHKTLLAVDALVLRTDLTDEEKSVQIQQTIQESLHHGKR